jgi:DNA modification methylase
LVRSTVPDVSYAEFIASKMQAQVPRADREAKAPWWDLFEWQHLLVERALSRGRSAMFADTGTGKTRMELAWAMAVCEVTVKPTLLLAPMAVSKQIVREAGEVGAEATYSSSGPSDWITVSNYERLHHFKASDFGAIVLDESSILKSFDGKTRRELTEFASTLAYRLCATATPAPNDYLELGQHSEFLSVLSGKEMMALYFTQDGNSTQKWRMKRHAEQDFWRWVSSWAIGMRRPSDVGFPEGDALYELPPLTIHQTEVVAENNHAFGTLFRDEARTLSERRTARKETLMERVEAAVALVAKEPNEQWLLWCDLNSESEQLAKLIPGAVEVRGSDSVEWKEAAVEWFTGLRCLCRSPEFRSKLPRWPIASSLTIQGGLSERPCTCGHLSGGRVLVSKPAMFGHGLNLQCCARMMFVGLSDSFERYYQAVRRCWRFGQTRPVEVYIVTADVEGAVVRNIESKQRRAEQMAEELLQAMSDRTLEHLEKGVYESDDAQGEHWRLMLGDCVERLSEVEDDSVGLTMFSPPFPSMYVYTDQTRDMGNVSSVEQMIEHFGYLVPGLLRVTMPGRSVAIHLAQAQTRKRDGEEIGLRDFRGATIAAMEAGGFTYYGEVCIDKDPQVKAIRTKDRGLLFKTLAKDSANMRMAQADYLLQFRKPGENPKPIAAGISERYGNEDGWITPEEWIEWAAPVWYRAGPDYPGGIRETDVLNVLAARDERDERHLCPLQLGVIERALKLWSAPGDLILSPFAGVGSEGVVAIGLNRRYVGIELKRSYWQTALRNLQNAHSTAAQGTLELV